MKLQLQYPITPFIINQNFGDDIACYNPVTKAVVTRTAPTCPAGFQSLYAASGMKGHNGTDLWASHGLELRACIEGFVEEVEADANRGLGLGIITENKYEFDGGEYYAKVRYWHLKSFNVTKGQKVKAGDIIGWADNTGYSSGDHLHLELKAVEKNSVGTWYNLKQNNGFYGACDPLPYIVAPAKPYILPFNTDLRYRDTSPEVKRLQQVLKDLGYFPVAQECTGYYGAITMASALEFQMENVNLSWWERNVLRGASFGPKSRVALNSLLRS